MVYYTSSMSSLKAKKTIARIRVLKKQCKKRKKLEKVPTCRTKAENERRAKSKWLPGQTDYRENEEQNNDTVSVCTCNNNSVTTMLADYLQNVYRYILSFTRFNSLDNRHQGARIGLNFRRP